MEIWRQCYFRWLSVVEIQAGGSTQIEMIHRLLLSNVNKLQVALQTQEFDEIPPRILSPILGDNSETESDPDVASGGAVTLAKVMPSVNSFFPFSSNSLTDPTELADILNQSNERLMDGSILDTMSQMDRDEPQQPWALPQPELRRVEEK